jgi:hypothetical protein
MKSTTQRLDCVICTEKYTPNASATCVYCQYTTCRTCVRTYVLNENIPQCMNCKKPWTREHQNAILKPIFVNGELKKHLEQVLFDRERSQFPATMSVIEDRRLTRKLMYERNVLTEEVSVLQMTERCIRTKMRELSALKRDAEIAPKMHPDISAENIDNQIKELQKDSDTLFRTQISHKSRRLIYVNRLFHVPPEQRRIIVENQIEGADPEDILHTIQTARQSGAVRRHFVRACPIETCRGFLSTQWKCGLCETHTCSTCHVPKTAEEHTCNPDDVATAELLAKDTRPCPKCGTGIFKIDGCDQMWCIECHSAFSWRTGQLELGHVHNPHFFEYQRRIGTNARNILDMPCDALNPDRYHGILHNYVRILLNRDTKKLKAKRGIPADDVEIESDLTRKTTDVAMSLPTFVGMLARYRQDAIQNNLELRVKYLTEEINEDQFRSSLFRDAKKFNVDREIGQVIQTVVFAMTDILNRAIEYLRENDMPNDNANLASPGKLLLILSEVNALMDYANECLLKICGEYKIVRLGMFLRNSRTPLPPPSGLFTVTAAGLYSVTVKRNEDGIELLEPKMRR